MSPILLRKLTTVIAVAVLVVEAAAPADARTPGFTPPAPGGVRAVSG
ncbi:hypothetical protein [Micromonospora sp. NPDC049102]